MLVKSVKIDWNWAGDTVFLKGFNIAVCQDADLPDVQSVSKTFANVQGSNNAYSFIFKDVILQDGGDYTAYIQAVYANKDSSWISSGGFLVEDDGLATISNANLTIEDVKAGAGWTNLPLDGATNNTTIYQENEPLEINSKFGFIWIRDSDKQIFTYNGTSWIEGKSGESPIACILSNESHTVPALNDGTVTSYTGSGTEIYVYEGLTALQYDGVGTSNGTWKIISTGSDVTTGSLSDQGVSAFAGTVSSMTADVASVSFRVIGKTIHGESFDFNRVQSLTKSKAGIIGVDGQDGSIGIDGLPGPVISLVTSKQAFTFTDDILDGGQSDIILDVVRQNTSETVTWTSVPSIITGTGNQKILTAASFGSNTQLAITITTPAGLTDKTTIVKLNQSTAEAGADITSSNKAAGLSSPDTRSVNSPPSFYYTKGSGVYTEFKQSSVIGAPTGTTYCQLVNNVPWSSVSGGAIVQTAYSGDNYYKRKSTSTTTWGAWTTVADGSDNTKTSFETGFTGDTGGIILGANASIRTTGKDSYIDTTSGVYMGNVSGVAKFGIGNGTNYISWDGALLDIKGKLTASEVDAPTITGGTLSASSISASSISASNISASSISASTMSGGAISGSSINIPGVSPKFSVDSFGNVTIKSALSGARMEISNSTVKVYDVAGRLRVQLGDLS